MKEIKIYYKIFYTISTILEFTPWSNAPVETNEMMQLFLHSLQVEDGIRYYLANDDEEIQDQ